MRKSIIYIPEGIYYLGDYQNLINLLPQGKYIFNKVMTGCGATTMFLSDSRPTVLCSPRKELIRCKAYSDDFYGKVHLFGESGDDPIEKINAMKQYLANTQSPKILVTYDSTKHVLQGLYEIEQYLKRPIIQNYNFVIDEFQTIFTDASFRGTVEAEFMQNLQYIDNVVFLSATPYLEKYLDILPEFNTLPYVELSWPDSSIHATQIHKEKYFRSKQQTIKQIIERFRADGYFHNALDKDATECFATQAVFYANDVRFILNTIKSNNLDPDDVIIICADSPENKARLKKAGLTIGHAPKRGEVYPTYMFITKASFEGTDLYSPNAYTYIFSDIKKDYRNMSIDISLDLPQIMGRQRLESNPFKYMATLYYNTCPEFSEEEETLHNEEIEQKSITTMNAIDCFDSIQDLTFRNTTAAKYRNSQEKAENYKNDYIAVVDDITAGGPRLVFNEYVKINEQRAWEVQKEQFTKDVYVMNSINTAFTANIAYHDIQVWLQNGFYGTFEDKMKKYSAFADTHPRYYQMLVMTEDIPLNIRKYYDQLGSDKLRTLSWKEANIKRVLYSIPDEDLLRAEIRQTFLEDWYSLADIKCMLQDIYNRLEISKNAKATDILDYFQCKPSKQLSEEGKRINGYTLL